MPLTTKPTRIRNKTLKIKSKLQSESFYNYTQTQGDKVVSCFSRAGVIFLFCANDTKLLKTWSEWVDKATKEYEDEVQSVTSQVEELKKRLPSEFELPEIEIPDNYVWNYDVSTPQVYNLTSLVLKMDALMSEVECLWLLGQVENVELATARNQAIGAVKRLMSSIYAVTSKGKRDNSPYRAAVFMELFRAQRTLPLNKSDKKDVIKTEDPKKEEATTKAKTKKTDAEAKTQEETVIES